MKKYVKIITPIIPFIIILFSVWFITVILTSGKWYYRWQFKKNNTLEKIQWTTDDGEQMTYTEEDLDKLAIIIPEYLFNKRDSMQIELNGHNFFSRQAIEHMYQVKKLYNRWSIFTICLLLISIPWLIYFIKHFNEMKGLLFKPTVTTYLVILGILSIVCIAMLINFDWIFDNFHHLLFWKRQNFEDAFFNFESNYPEDNSNPYINNILLVTVLDIYVFIDAAWIIVLFILITIATWFIFTYKWRNKKVEA